MRREGSTLRREAYLSFWKGIKERQPCCRISLFIEDNESWCIQKEKLELPDFDFLYAPFCCTEMFGKASGNKFSALLWALVTEFRPR